MPASLGMEPAYGERVKSKSGRDRDLAQRLHITRCAPFLGGSADDPHPAGCPQRLDQPAGFVGGPFADLGGAQDLQFLGSHAQRAVRTGATCAFGGLGTEKTSKYSFSSIWGNSFWAAALSSSPQRVIRTR